MAHLTGWGRGGALIGLLVGGLLVWGWVGRAWDEATRWGLMAMWVGLGLLSLAAYGLRFVGSGAAGVLLPMGVRLIGWPLWIAAVAAWFRPKLEPFLVGTLMGMGLFLGVEVLLTLRNLRRRV